MKKSTRILPGILGMAHLLVAITLLPTVMFLGFLTTPIFLPGLIWLAILGVRILRANTSVQTALRVTHSLLTPLAILLVVYGFYCLQSGQRSSETGGGLLGTFGLIPIVMGTLTGSLSVASLIFSFFNEEPGTTRDEQNLKGHSGKAGGGPSDERR